MARDTPSNEVDQPLSIRTRSNHDRQDLPRPGRTQLLFEFDMQRDLLSKEKEPFDYFLPEPYPPSRSTLKGLTPINIGDLHVDERHVGGVLFAKTIESPIRAAAVQTIIEDEEALAERLAVYNIDLRIDPEEFLPEHSIIAIKEPTLTASASGGYIIRVDHPSDLMVLDSAVDNLPVKLLDSSLSIQKSPLEWKQEGNAAYLARKYIVAVFTYTKGLNACTSNDVNVKSDLFRNRAAANIFLGRYKQGQLDAESAVIHSDDNAQGDIKALNTKSYERAAHAAYSRGDYDRATELYKKALELSPAREELLEASKKVQDRRNEQSKGSYDFEKMSTSCSKKRNRLDHADFVSNTERRDAGKHGRGLFAVKSLEAGDLIVCEKALSVSFDSDPVSKSFSILNSKEKKRSTGTKPQLLFSVCSRLIHDIDLAKKYFELYDGGTKNTSPDVIDSVVPVDAFRALSILDHNSHACSTTKSSSRESQIQLLGDGYPSAGLWPRISYINHACNGNAMKSFIGDMMIIRATRNIAKDEEIFVPYILPNIDNTITQSQIQQIWGFKCDCGLCIAETSSTTNQRKARVQLNNDIRTLAKQAPTGLKIGPIEQIYTKIKQTYNDKRFNQRPRVALVGAGWLRCKIYNQDKAWTKLSEAGIDLLQDLGYRIDVSGHKLQIDQQHCLTQHVGIDAAMYASHAYNKKGNREIGMRFHDLAKLTWVVLYGSGNGFDDRIKELLES